MDKEQNEFDLRKSLNIILSNLWMIILVSIAFAVAGALVTKFIIKPVYKSSAMLIVNNQQTQSSNNNSAITSEQLKTANELVETYGIIIKSDTVLDTVIDNLKLRENMGMEDITFGDIAKQITVVAENDTQIMRISVESTNQKLAQDITSEIVKISPEIIIKTVKAGSVEIVSPAREYGKVSPSLMINTAISFLIGIVVSLLIAFLKSILDNTITSEEDITSYLDMPVLGVIPRVEGKKE